MLMPPVMGAGAFVMAEITGISYVKIVIAAMLGAILYYVSLVVRVHFTAQRENLVGMREEDMVTSLVLGMGLPCTPAYIIAITIGGPALLAMGADMLPAHLFVFYFAILAGITPPVCVPAFCAASIAKSKPLQTGFEALKLALVGFLIPYVFVFNKALLMEGSPLEIITVTVVLVVAVLFFAAALSGYFFKPLNIGWRILLFVLAALTTVLCGLPEVLNSPMVRIPGGLVLLAVCTSPLWKKSAGSGEA